MDAATDPDLPKVQQLLNKRGWPAVALLLHHEAMRRCASTDGARWAPVSDSLAVLVAQTVIIEQELEDIRKHDRR